MFLQLLILLRKEARVYNKPNLCANPTENIMKSRSHASLSSKTLKRGAKKGSFKRSFGKKKKSSERLAEERKDALLLERNEESIQSTSVSNCRGSLEFPFINQ